MCCNSNVCIILYAYLIYVISILSRHHTSSGLYKKRLCIFVSRVSRLFCAWFELIKGDLLFSKEPETGAGRACSI